MADPSKEQLTKNRLRKQDQVVSEEGILAELKGWGVEVPRSFATGVQAYLRLLRTWNEKANLTSIGEPSEILARHFGESIFGAQIAGIQSGDLLDVGSGAGFPAVPVAMLREELRAVLLEPNLKKAAFLHEVIRELALESRVRILRTRLEDYVGNEPGFDLITSRAVRVTSEFLGLCRRHLRPGGRVVLWLGGGRAEEVKGVSGWEWSKAELIPGSSGRFVIVGRFEGSGVPRETQRPSSL